MNPCIRGAKNKENKVDRYGRGWNNERTDSTSKNFRIDRPFVGPKKYFLFDNFKFYALFVAGYIISTFVN